MPPADKPLNPRDTLLRLMLYGPPKTRKTWWILNAVMSGYRVILFDSDDGRHIYKQIPPEYRHRIILVNIVDDFKRPVACVFLTTFLTGADFYWDEEAKLRIQASSSINPEHNMYYFSPKLLDHRTIVVVDSWTKLARSVKLKIAVEKQIDLSDVDSLTDRWGFYEYADFLSNWFLTQLHALPCHLVVIGHQVSYDKYTGEKKDRKLEWSRMQPDSVSKPHGQKLASDFSDILYFELGGNGETRIDTRPSADRDGGCRVIPPGLYEWSGHRKLQWDDVCKFAELPIYNDDPPPCAGIQYYKPGELTELAPTGITAQLLAKDEKREPIYHEGHVKTKINLGVQTK